MASKGFRYPDVKGKSWFPGHMAKGFKEATIKMKNCHCVIEVHDARIPNSGRNRDFVRLINNKPHLLVLNKVDLCDQDITRMNIADNTILTDCKTQHHPSIKQLSRHSLLSLMIARLHYYSYQMQLMNSIMNFEEDNNILKVMIIGIPNVGKSSLINALRRNYLRKGKGAPTGKQPGITRRLSQFIKISEHPPIVTRDTPGILLPHIDNGKVLMKLAAIGSMRDHLIGEMLIAEYLLSVMNEKQKFKYIDMYNLTEPCTDYEQFLQLAAMRLNAYSKGGSLDTIRSANHFIEQFRAGRLGTITFDY